MSKFEEISLAYRKSRRAFLDYERECQSFARDLVFGMVEYFEWPSDQEINYIPLGEELDPNNKFYALAGAMRMDAESFWHFGVELTVHEPGGSYPIPFILSFFIKKAGSNFVVKLGPKGRQIKIPADKDTPLDPFYDAVSMQLVEFFKKRYHRALTGQETDFGFITIVPAEE
jgi:hypothetical protein